MDATALAAPDASIVGAAVLAVSPPVPPVLVVPPVPPVMVALLSLDTPVAPAATAAGGARKSLFVVAGPNEVVVPAEVGMQVPGFVPTRPAPAPQTTSGTVDAVQRGALHGS